MTDNKLTNPKDNMQGFIADVRKIMDEACVHAVRRVDSTRVAKHWSIGRRIFEEEQ